MFSVRNSLRALGLAVLMCATANAGTYQPLYPLTYWSGVAGTSLASGVIYAGPGLLSGCEVQNGSVSAQYYFLFDSLTVPANGTVTNVIAFAYCPAATTCTINGMGPAQIYPNGGVGMPAVKGMAWSNSTTFPTKTLGAADSSVLCRYSIQP